jgi:hypothetical protein
MSALCFELFINSFTYLLKSKNKLHCQTSPHCLELTEITNDIYSTGPYIYIVLVLEHLYVYALEHIGRGMIDELWTSWNMYGLLVLVTSFFVQMHECQLKV